MAHPQAQLTAMQARQINLMKKTLIIWQNIIAPLSQEQATTLRHGADGWTILEVLCHVRDFDGFFYGRAQMIMAEDTPKLPAYDHETIAIEQKYNEQDLAQTLSDLVASRAQFVSFFESLNEADWRRAGIHPEQGYFTLLTAAAQVASHDITHIEQVTKILLQLAS